jgi:glycosyltransferase involved in cell wall biosynthesis
MGKLRIAVWHNLPSGGAKRALWQAIEGLLKLGHHIEAWCPSTADQKYLPLGGLCQEHILPVTLPADKRSLPLMGWLADSRTMQARIAAMREHCRESAGQINAGGFDILLANSCRSFTVPSIARYIKIPKAMIIGEPSRRMFEALPEFIWAAPVPRSDQQTTSMSKLFRTTLKLASVRLEMREEIENAKHFDRLLTFSRFAREGIARAYGIDAGVWYCGIDTGQFHPTDEARGNYVIGLGAVHHHKGVDRAIRAVGMIAAPQRPKLIWVGNDSHASTTRAYQDLAKSLGVDFEIKVMVPDQELISLLRRAAVMLYTSRLEPFGLAPLEANACGTPVVAIAEGGVRESIVPGENGLLADDARPETVAAVLRGLLENPARLAELRQKCRAAVEARWSMAGGVERLETALTTLVMEKART